MKRLWNIGGMTVTEQNKAVRENPALLHFVHHISHTDWPGIKPGTLRLQPSDQLPETWSRPNWL